MSFRQLFKRSTFARYNPRIPFIFAKSIPETVLPNEDFQFEASTAPAQFGFKNEPPAKQHGKSLDYVSFTSFDGNFGLPNFTDRKDRVLKTQILNQLQRLLSSGVKNFKIPGRILESCEGGFLVGIGPVRAHLPQSEIPAGASFNYYDMLDKKAFYFYLKSARETDTNHLRKTTVSSDIFNAPTEIQNNSKRQMTFSSTYAKYAQEQGFNVILTLRK
jgi:hypothetical protein